MKYIRTKDGEIFDTHALDKYNSLEPRFIIEENRLIIFDLRDERLIANHGEVLKQADTIEELCDEFVVKYIDNSTSVFCSQGLIRENGHITFEETRLDLNEFVDYLTKEENEIIKEIYGAIWTDKGLIYVAKMNDRGEFELL